MWTEMINIKPIVNLQKECQPLQLYKKIVKKNHQLCQNKLTSVHTNARSIVFITTIHYMWLMVLKEK